MTTKEFNERLTRMEREYEAFFSDAAPLIVGNIAVKLFKENFQSEGFFGEKWREVKRRQDTWERGGKKVNNPTKGAARLRKVLTGDTGDLGRSIAVKEAANARAVVWTDPAAFGSREPYGRVHNEGLRAGRGAGFTMPRRQFIGRHEKLMQAITGGLQVKFKELVEKQRKTMGK
jgi:phage gpG-like protein